MIEDYRDMRPRDRIRKVEINQDALMRFCTTGLFLECIEGLPERSKLVGAGYDPDRRNFFMIVESMEFEAVSPGEEIPKSHAMQFKSYFGKELSVIRKLIESVKKGQNENASSED